ncbi:MAG: phage holin family protein [Gemmatimonadaceae bacterium]
MGDLLRELVEGSAHLVRQETRLARLEVSGMLRGVGAGTAQVATGGVLLFLGMLALFTGVILLAGDQWLRDRYWLAALIVSAVVGGTAVMLVKRGQGLLAPERLAPDQTVATLQEDKEWLKQRLTSGATSR